MAKLHNNPKRPPRHWWRGCVRGVRDSGSAQDPESVCGALWYQKMSEGQRREILKAEGKSMDTNPRTFKKMVLVDVHDGPYTRGEAEYHARVIRKEWPSRKVSIKKTPSGLKLYVYEPRTFRMSRDNPKPCLTGDCAPLPNPNGIGGYLIAGAVIAGLAWLLWPKAASAQPSPPVVTPPSALPPAAYCPLDANTLSAWASSKGYALFYFQMAQPPAWDWMLKNVPTLPAVLAAGTPVLVVLQDGSFWTFSGGVPAPAPAQKDLYCQFAAVQASNPVSPGKTVKQ